MYMERKESRGRRGASWELPQQSGPIAAELWDVSGSPEPSLTISFIIKETLNLILKVEKVATPQTYTGSWFHRRGA